ncbi:MAG: MBL fold metallo-hydrolase [Candidatus Paceibacterota bacterium]|jgi:metallo-beta-lactamase family protein|nr:MBL fold metallo-hydrolase [bacterium]
MKIFFCGACREVTGSCILVETEKIKFIVDCGLFQDDKSKMKNSYSFGFDPSEIDFVLLTHAHTDHCGRLPKLYKEGFRGNIYCTPVTIDLSEQMMIDSAKVFLSDDNINPIYFPLDVEKTMTCFSPVPYGQDYSINKEVRIKLSDAGHILGSAIFEVWIKDGKNEKKLVFSGDLGNSPAPIVKDTEFVNGADVVFIESTYGTKTHMSRELGRSKLKESIVEVIKDKGTLVIPVFALERTQEIIFELKNIFKNENVKEIPVFLDSPLAVRVTDIYRRYSNYFDEEVKKLVGKKDDLFYFDGFKMTRKKGDSLGFSRLSNPKIVLAGSGMCNGGRVLDHLKKNLPIANNRVLIISFQVEGSLGRKLAEGAKEVIIGEKKVKVRANVSKIEAFSSHADFPRLLAWIRKIKNPSPKNVFVIHGEEDLSVDVAKVLKSDLGLNAIVPEYGKVYEV